MSEFAIEVEGGKSVRLKTAGKYCDRNIVVTATNGGGGDTDAAYQQGVADGKQAEYDRFWDAYQDNGNRTAYDFAFYLWGDDSFNPKYDLIPTSGSSMFQACTITRNEKLLSADFSQCKSFHRAFYMSTIEELGVIDLASCTNIGQTFEGAKSLTKIAKVISYEGVSFQSTSFNARSLTDVTFEGVIATTLNFQWCPLSVESMKSIILCLKDYSGTDKEYAYTVKFSDACWAALNAEGNTAPGDISWEAYAVSKCWST
jgi:hypothetical protein